MKLRSWLFNHNIFYSCLSAKFVNSFKNMQIFGNYHLKIIFPLFSCLIGKKISFPRIHMKNIPVAVRDLFGRVVRWENFTRNQHLKWVTQSRRKTDQFCCVCIRACIVVFDTIFLWLVGDICLRFKDKSICCLPC